MEAESLQTNHRDESRLLKIPLWQPSRERIEASTFTRFIEFVNIEFNRRFQTYDELYHWSVNEIRQFWSALWKWEEIKFSRTYTSVLDNSQQMPGAKWFAGAELNFAENLLRNRDNHPAIIFQRETGIPTRLSYSELYESVAYVAEALRDLGVRQGDRVVGYMPNIPETAIAMLATTSIGAVWSACSTELAVNSVVERFVQIRPKVIFTIDGYSFGGKRHDCVSRIKRIVEEIPSIERVVIVPYRKAKPSINSVPRAMLYNDFFARRASGDIQFDQVPFNHPVYIMYSSGTTGLPKCIVHSVGGVLLQHIKELEIHTDLKRKDTIFYYTTPGWMMWNWLLSGLHAGATLILYDGSPLFPDSASLWGLAQREGITVFGTSARYLQTIEKEGIKPGKDYDLRQLRTIVSTGSPLSAESFHYVYRDIKRDVQLSSISGGTDINGCFALGNPVGPVFAGELQCRGLGMKVEAFDPNGKSVINQKGELVCTAPFPSMPIHFWNDPQRKKYINSYFKKYPNVWTHGDYVEITDTGGVIIYGRSDATLNPGGIRIGTAEIYRQVESLPEIADSIVVGQNYEQDVRIILFVKLSPGAELTEELKKKIVTRIRERASARHVPAKIIAVEHIPHTFNMKKVELAVKNVIHGEPVLNRQDLLNPEALACFVNLPELGS